MDKIDRLTEQYMRNYDISHEHFEAIKDLVSDIMSARKLLHYARYLSSQHLSNRYSEHQLMKNETIANAIKEDIDTCEKFEKDVDHFINYSLNCLK